MIIAQYFAAVIKIIDNIDEHSLKGFSAEIILCTQSFCANE